MVERPLSMREVPGSIPGFSNFFFFFSFNTAVSSAVKKNAVEGTNEIRMNVILSY